MSEDSTDLLSHLNRQNEAKKLSGLAKEMWFPIRVCTPHQVLRYTLRGKGWEYMLAEFPNACFVFDEIHAYDPRLVGLTLSSARLMSQWGARCLFLSATFPSFLRKMITDRLGVLPFIEPDSSLDEDRKILNKKRHNIEVVEGSLLDHIETIVQAIQKRTSTLIVCNHVRTSQEIHSMLSSRLPSENIKLLHSRFNQEDRNRIEDEIINRSIPKALVATQVVEVSLDVDFEQAFLEPAPIDALIQRMGRVNRFGLIPPAIVRIHSKQVNARHLYCDCPSGFHEPNCRETLTFEQLQNLRNPISEMDLVEAADKVYGEGYQGGDKTKFEQGFHHPDLEEFKDSLLAGAHQDWVKIIEKADGTIEVLPRKLLDEYNRRKENGLWIEAESLVVPVRNESLSFLKTRIDTSYDPPIADLNYTSERGLEI